MAKAIRTRLHSHDTVVAQKLLKMLKPPSQDHAESEIMQQVGWHAPCKQRLMFSSSSYTNAGADLSSTLFDRWP